MLSFVTLHLLILGKSTCVQLLLRFYDPVDGFIRVNNDCRIDEINVESYRQQIAVVSQEPVSVSHTKHLK